MTKSKSKPEISITETTPSEEEENKEEKEVLNNNNNDSNKEKEKGGGDEVSAEGGDVKARSPSVGRYFIFICFIYINIFKYKK